MNEREALMRAICENPDEDAPRLVFADWLAEHGEEERAEFIRVQCEMVRVATNDVRFDELHRRAYELLGVFGDRWFAELPTPNEHIMWTHGNWLRGAHGDWLSGTPFDRGFPARLWVRTAESLVVHAGDLFAATPVRRLMVVNVPNLNADKVAHIPQLRHLHSFRVRILSRLAARRLAESPYLGNVPDIRLPLRYMPAYYVDLLRERFGNRLKDLQRVDAP